MNIHILPIPGRPLATRELADAVPLRLSCMATFACAPGTAGANDRLSPAQPRPLRGRYAPTPGFQRLFRVR